jgi:hypothetical protein
MNASAREATLFQAAVQLGAAERDAHLDREGASEAALTACGDFAAGRSIPEPERR